VFRSPTLRVAGLAALFVAAALFGIASGVMFAFVGDLPGLPSLETYSPNVATRVLARDGALVGEFATERREVIRYQDIAVHLRQAIVSAEDSNFFKHSGLDLAALVARLAKDVLRGQSAGASTLTQQLARNLFPDSIGFQKTPERKIKEALVAMQLEKRYTKEEIFAMYCNQIYFGHGAYGVEAASKIYFGKSARDLSLPEAAMIAGIIQGNVSQSPYVNMTKALNRRAYALGRMVAEGYITQAQADQAKEAAVILRGDPGGPSVAPYFTELVRRHLEERYGAKAMYEGGLTVKTSLDIPLQRAANLALDTGLRRLDKLRGFRRPARNLLTEKRDIDKYRLPSWSREPTAGAMLQSVVLSAENGVIRVKYNRFTGTIDKTGYAWTKRAAEQAVRRGDVVDVRVRTLDAATQSFTADLDQPPSIEGAILVIDNKTGDILAMVGGSSYERSQFNRATQALRQVGSSFKPIVYTAAIDRGYTATSILIDSPASFPAGPNQPMYEPKNYDRKYEGSVTLRHALEDSRNVPTIRLMAALGADQVIAFARRFGITSPLPPYLPIAIGAGDASLLEMTSAYTAFPNQGVRMTPQPLRQVLDREGTILEDVRSEAHDVIRADAAYVMTYLLQGVVQHGTGRRAADQIPNWPLGGKTGTTDDYTDAWFIGFDPDITIGVWVGFDQKKPIGEGQSGTVAALPIWIDVMKSWVDRRRPAVGKIIEFARPGSVVLVQTANGVEAFVAGTEPVIR
jgi:penicillin-binding protein 1A